MKENWHSEQIERMKGLSMHSLCYIRDDARAAAVAGETINNPNTGKYWDEYHYACMEIHRRKSSDTRD